MISALSTGIRKKYLIIVIIVVSVLSIKLSEIANSPGNSPGAATLGYLVTSLEVHRYISYSSRRTITP